MELETQPKMVGREDELTELKTCLERARQGHGNTVFITGEAGVGKTRLFEELKGYAKEQGVDVLQGWSLYESLTPYMPFLEALRSGGLENLFADEAPKVEAIYLLSHSGMSIKEVIREETKLDPDIFTGMLTAVGDFVKDSLSMLTGQKEKGSLNTLGYKNYRILIETLGELNLAVILTGRENEFLVNDMKKALVNVNQKYGSVLKSWDGNEKSVEGIQNILNTLITSGKFDGIDYTKDNPQIKRNKLFDNILLGIERHAKVNPSLLCIEDLQWADPSSLALLHYVSRNTQNCNLLIVGTYRPEDVSSSKEGEPHHLINTMQLMSREDLFQKIELERLTEEHMDELLLSFFKRSNFPDEFKAQLYKESEGNPFFIISMIRMLLEEGTIDSKDDIWILTKELNELNIPSKVYDVIIRRLFRVKEKEREILDFAAVIGEEFTSDILAKTVQINKIELLKHLRNLEQSHNLIRAIKQKFKFDHAKIKEILYQHIPYELKMEYHGIVAYNIELLNKDNLNKVVEDLAYHYYNSINKKKALTYLVNAADKAKKDYSNEEAILFFNRGLEIEEQVQKKIELYISLGDVYLLIADFEKSLKAYNNALGLSHEKKRRAEIMVKMGIIYTRLGENEKSIKICNEAVNLVKGEKSKTESDALLRAGMLYFRLGNPDQALEYYYNSLEIKNKINDLSGIAYLFKEIGGIYWQRGNYEKALGKMKESVHMAEKSGNQVLIGICLGDYAIVYHLMGNYNKAMEYYKKSLKIAEKTGNQLDTSIVLMNLGDLTLHAEKYDDALDYLNRSQLISEKIGFKSIIIWCYILKAELYLTKGELTKALELSNKALDLSSEFGYKEIFAYSNRILGMIYSKQKKWDESLEYFNESLKLYQEIGMKREMADTHYMLGLMWKAKGDSNKAKQSLNTALNMFNDIKVEKYIKKVKKELQECKE